MIDKKDLQYIIKMAKSRKAPIPIFCVTKDNKALGNMWVKIRKFKKVGFLMEVDLPYDIDGEVIVKIRKYLEWMLQDILTPGFKEQLHVGRGSVVGAFYEGDEETALGFVFEAVGAYSEADKVKSGT